MSAIFGELMSFDQDNGPEVKLRVYGDEFYARYETEEGYTAIYDEDLGLFTYARLRTAASSPAELIWAGPPLRTSPSIWRNQMRCAWTRPKKDSPEASRPSGINCPFPSASNSFFKRCANPISSDKVK